MDRSRYRRPATQTQRQIQKNPFGSPPPVPKVVSSRPRDFDLIIKRPAPARSSSAPSLQSMALAATVSRPVPVSGLAAGSDLPQAASPIAAVPVAVPALPPAPPAGRLPLDMELPGGESEAHIIRRAKWRGLRRNASRGLAVALVLLITMGGLIFSQSYLKLHKVFKGGTGTAAALKANVNPALLKGEGQGRVNVLLLGRGGGNHDGPDLTDTMMLASIDPVNHTATLLSLPRDLWVNVPNQGVMKLNAAWETGEFKYIGKVAPGSTNPKAITAGFDMVDETIQGVLGVNVDYNVLVDFQAFQQAVDTVGGISVNVPTDLVDPTMAWENNGNATLATAGTQNFGGKQALIYVRSRETSSDFARAQRQRSVLLALKSKVETLGTLSNPFKLSGLFNAFGNNVQTDLSLSNANRLYSIVKGISGANINSIDLNNNSTPGATQYVADGNINGQSIVLPKAGLFQYNDIQQFVRGQLKDPYIIKENARIMLLNGTPIVGLATTKATDLKGYGYNVVQVGNTPNGGWTQTTLVDLTHGKDKYTKNYLEKHFNTKAVTSLTDTSIQTNGADFVIIIGNDQANVTQP